jgi:hypothetical protein
VVQHLRDEHPFWNHVLLHHAVYDWKASFIGKLDSSGVEQWLIWIDGSGTEERFSICHDLFGNIYATGWSNTTGTTIRFGSNGSFAKPATGTERSAYIAKIDTNGGTQWLRWITGTGIETIHAVATDSSGNVEGAQQQPVQGILSKAAHGGSGSICR